LKHIPNTQSSYRFRDSAAAPKEGLKVYTFDGATYNGYHAVTDTNG
jgi:hypothetical protein